MKLFLRYTTFNILGMLGISCYIWADTFFVANGIGANGLAALNLAIPIYSFVHGGALMLGIGGSTKYTIAQSQGEHTRANIIFNNCLMTTLIIAALCIILALLLSQQITVILGANQDLFQMTHTYLRVILLFAPFFMCNELFLAFVRSDGNPALSMTAMVSGSVANIILDYIFIYPMKMGILGAVLATGIAPIISMSILLLHKLQQRNNFHLIRCSLRIQTICGSMILGFPSFVAEVSAGIVMIILNTLILKIAGNTGVAAYGIIANIALVVSAIFSGLTQGIQPLVSTAYGHKNSSAITSYLKYSAIYAGIITLIIYGSIFVYSNPIVALFNGANNSTLQSMAEFGLKLYFLSTPFAALNIILSGFFTAIDNPIPAHVISLLRGLILVIPAAFILSSIAGITGIWLTLPVSEASVAILAIYIWKKSKK